MIWREGISYRFAGNCSLSRKSAIIFNCCIKHDGNPTNWHLINGYWLEKQLRETHWDFQAMKGMSSKERGRLPPTSNYLQLIHFVHHN